MGWHVEVFGMNIVTDSTEPSLVSYGAIPAPSLDHPIATHSIGNSAVKIVGMLCRGLRKGL